MIVDQGNNFYDVHCDGCGECQNYQGVFSKSQLAKAIKADGWTYVWTEEKFIHYCPICIFEAKKKVEKHESRKLLIENLKHIVDPSRGFFDNTDDPEAWRNVVHEALEIIEKEES